jgi:hypothetical protein
MSAGISRVHGYAFLPSQRPSSLTFYNLTINGDQRTEATVVNGAIDQIFRTALPTFATVAMVGGTTYTGGNTIVNFAIEDTGVDQLSITGLGLGSTSQALGYGTGNTGTAAALQAAVRALGSSVGPNTVNVSTATVAFGVAAVSAVASTYGL